MSHNGPTIIYALQYILLLWQTVVCRSRNGPGEQCKPLKPLTLKTTKIHLKRPFKVLYIHIIMLVTDMPYQYIKIYVLSVRPSVCNGSSPEVAWPRTKSCSQLETQATGGHGEDAVVHATGKATSEFNVLDKNEIRVDTYLSRSPDGEAAWFMAND